MDHSGSSTGKSEALHIDPSIRGESSFSVHRSHSSGHEPFAPGHGSSIGGNVSSLSSPNSDCEIIEETRVVTMNVNIESMFADRDILSRYPEFYQFLISEQPTWFEPAPHNGTVYRVHQTTPLPENHRKLRKELPYEMLDLMYRFYEEKHVNALRKRENKELLKANKQLRFAQSLMANVAKIPDVHGDEAAEKLMADKQQKIERLRTYCSRAEKSYQEELMRLRAEKVDHESALEQEQELLINTLEKRMSQMNEEKRKLQRTLETVYVNGFIDFIDTVDVAIHAAAAHRKEPNPSAVTAHSPIVRSFEQPPPSSSRQQMNEIAHLHIENKKLVELCNQEKRRALATEAEVKKLNQRMSKMEAMFEARVEAVRSDGTLAGRLAALSHDNSIDEHPIRPLADRRAHGGSPPTVVVQPTASRAGTSPLADLGQKRQEQIILSGNHTSGRNAHKRVHKENSDQYPGRNKVLVAQEWADVLDRPIDGFLECRRAASNHDNNIDEHPIRSLADRRAHGGSPPTVVVQPTAIRAGTSNSVANSIINEHPHAMVAPVWATVYPTQRPAAARNERLDQHH